MKIAGINNNNGIGSTGITGSPVALVAPVALVVPLVMVVVVVVIVVVIIVVLWFWLMLLGALLNDGINNNNGIGSTGITGSPVALVAPVALVVPLVMVVVVVVIVVVIIVVLWFWLMLLGALLNDDSNILMPKRIDKLIGLITHQGDDGLLYVFVPGKHPELIIDQSKTLNDEQCFRIGDFISFININDSITSPIRIKNLFETRFVNNRLQVKVLVAVPPEHFSERANFTTVTPSTDKMLAWSPDFAFIGCSFDVVKKLRKNQMYSAWIERVPQVFQSVANIFVSWQIVDDIFDECCEEDKQLIMKAPWNCKNSTQLSRILSYSDCSQQMKQKAPHTSRHFVASLKKYIDNYEGLVIAVHDSSAKVWSLAIPDSEIVFFLGARKGMKVGDWVRFNCTPSRSSYLGCHLQGKKFEIIEPILPAKAFNNTVQVEITTTIAIDNLKYYPTGEITLETEILGAVEFSPNRFRQDYCNRCLSLFICKIMASERTNAVWHVFGVVNEIEIGNTVILTGSIIVSHFFFLREL
uniref:Bm9851 n=1 Tax=Brugia malayi TaxID=6279 RepID=A0A0H5S6N5_BRUMA|nr:Bm9851 [Brugia malayi]